MPPTMQLKVPDSLTSRTEADAGLAIGKLASRPESIQVGAVAEPVIINAADNTVRSMRTAFVLNLAFACIEVVGGILTNSVTILSDAVHDLGDSIAIGLSLILEKKSRKGATERFHYGQRRFSILAAFITALVLILGAMFIIKEAVSRFWNLEAVHSEGVIWLAVLGVAFNGLAVFKLKAGSQNSLSQKAMMLHLLEDVLGWVAVLIGAVIMHYTSWFWIDPLLSIGIALMILFNGGKTLYHTCKIFLQTAPEHFDRELITTEFVDVPGVLQVDKLMAWSMDDSSHILTAYVTVSHGLHTSELKLIETKIKGIAMQLDFSSCVVCFQFA